MPIGSPRSLVPVHVIKSSDAGIAPPVAAWIATGAPRTTRIPLGSISTVVFVGGSFTRRGGQNILEPAACGKPVLFGPRMENFQDSVQVLVGRGGLQVRDAAALLRILRDLLARPGELLTLGQLARDAVSAVRGASARDARLIADLVPEAA